MKELEEGRYLLVRQADGQYHVSKVACVRETGEVDVEYATGMTGTLKPGDAAIPVPEGAVITTALEYMFGCVRLFGETVDSLFDAVVHVDDALAQIGGDPSKDEHGFGAERPLQQQLDCRELRKETYEALPSHLKIALDEHRS